MKVFSIIFFAILGTALTVLAAPAPAAEPDAKPVPAPVARPKPFPGELAMVEARDVFEGGVHAYVDGGDDNEDDNDDGLGSGVKTLENGGPDSVEPEEKSVSVNKRAAGSLFKRQYCGANRYWCGANGGCCIRSPSYGCCDFGCCRPGYHCCGFDGRCWRSWMC